MFLGEPPYTPYDLRFRLGTMPVRIHPMFWLVSVILGINLQPKLVLLWVVVVFVSILIHELGHALTARAFGWDSHIVLYGMGGLAIFQPTHRSRAKQMLVTAAGPLAGFAFAALIVCAMLLGNRATSFLGLVVGRGEFFSNPDVQFVVAQLLWVNVAWGLVNCLPVFPLDGGQFAREILTAVNPRQGMLWTLQLSMLVAALIAVASVLFLQSFYIAVLFGFLAYSSFSTMRAMQDRDLGGW